MREYWLDVGAGVDAEHWAATPAPAYVCRVAMDPLLTSGMAASGRLAALPPDMRRVGGEIRPERSVEAGKAPSFLPFRSDVFTRVHCGFVLHLYLETLERLVDETHWVLLPSGELEVFIPHFGDVRSEQIIQRTTSQLEIRYGRVEVRRAAGPFTTFWADLYRDCTYRLVCRKEPSK